MIAEVIRLRNHDLERTNSWILGLILPSGTNSPNIFVPCDELLNFLKALDKDGVELDAGTKVEINFIKEENKSEI